MQKYQNKNKIKKASLIEYKNRFLVKKEKNQILYSVHGIFNSRVRNELENFSLLILFFVEDSKSGTRGNFKWRLWAVTISKTSTGLIYGTVNFMNT